MTTPNDVIVYLRKLDFCSMHAVKTWQDGSLPLKIYFSKKYFYILKIFFKMTTRSDVVVDFPKLEFCSTHAVKT